MNLPHLPISDVLDEIDAKLSNTPNLIIAAPPGAGKTTLVPLKLLQSNWIGSGKIILIEPRRLAARAAARRMAQLLDQDVGQIIGYRMRLDTRVSGQTRVEVVTEGVFTRMVLEDPELSGTSCVIFDEFHERALDADFGLALALDVQAGLREDLRIAVMSATLDIAEISRILPDANIVVSEGRSYPVDIRYQPKKPRTRIEDVVVDAVMKMLSEEEGSILCFLPGMGEINRVYDQLETKIYKDIDLYRLYGSLSSGDQDQAIRPSIGGKRKVVLATSIAETSITIDGVRIIIDSGLQRQAFFEVGTGITRLETVRASQASTTQRSGRAGRTAPGIALRLWQKEQQAGLPEFSPPQILTSDLSALLLDCLAWGVADLADLSFITNPPEKAIDAAFGLLEKLGAVDTNKRLTKLGQMMRDIALPVRLSSMVLKAGEKGSHKLAAKLAVLLTEQGLGGAGVDLELRLKNFERDKSPRAKSAKNLADRIAKSAEKMLGQTGSDYLDPDEILAIGFPDRIAKQRGKIGVYTMSNGRGAVLDDVDPLSKEDMLVVADLTGKAQAPRILSAIRFDPISLQSLSDHLITECEEYQFDRDSLSVRGRMSRKLGAITLSEKPLPKPKGEAAIAAISGALRQLEPGYAVSLLPFSQAANSFRGRSEFYRLHSTTESSANSAGSKNIAGPKNLDWPDMSDQGLIDSLELWFSPFQTDISGLRDIKAKSLENGLKSLLSWEQQHQFEQDVPTHFSFPDGKRVEIKYKDEDALMSIRVQQLFGQTLHPSIMAGQVNLLLELLSPAGRPVQLTRDLPGFWSGSWQDVRADMRSRYPKHDWPDNPANAKPPQRRRR